MITTCLEAYYEITAEELIQSSLEIESKRSKNLQIPAGVVKFLTRICEVFLKKDGIVSGEAIAAIATAMFQAGWDACFRSQEADELERVDAQEREETEGYGEDKLDPVGEDY